MTGIYQRSGENSSGWPGEFRRGLYEQVVGMPQESRGPLERLIYERGVQIVGMLMDEQVSQLVGERYKRDGKRGFTRWGRQDGYVRLAGKELKMKRPRVRGANGGAQRDLTLYGAFEQKQTSPQIIYDKLIRGISMRDYEGAITGLLCGYAVDKSSVSRQFLKASASRLEELMSRRLHEKEFLAIGIDGIELGGHLVVGAIGIDSKGRKEVLGIWAGATQNAQLCKMLIEELIERGLDVSRKYLFVIDGCRALRKAIREVFGEDSLVQRCQVHRRRNVLAHLPKQYHDRVTRTLEVAYNMASYEGAKNQLLDAADYLGGVSP